MQNADGRWAGRGGLRMFAVTVVFLGLVGELGSQQPQQPGTNLGGPPVLIPDATNRSRDDNPLGAAAAARQEKLRNDERQKRLVADTDKLLALATQLHDDVGKTDKNILSVDVVKRADEIEKLAHAVKERMKNN
jgi:hypothetical protein